MTLVACGDSDGSGQPAGSARSEAAEDGGRRTGEQGVEEFGNEAVGDERAAILAAFDGYLNAVAGEDYAAACGYLAAETSRSLKGLVVEPLRRRGCSAILPKALSPTAPALAAAQARGEVSGVRVDGDQAFAIFRAPGAELWVMTMAREGDEWKATTVAATVLVPDLP